METMLNINFAAADSFLNVNDQVGISFFVATMIMMASAVFFFMERGNVKGKWRTSVTVAGLITGIAAIHYLYMRDMWVDSYNASEMMQKCLMKAADADAAAACEGQGSSPTVFRYVDWFITVPLQIIEFYLILAAIAVVPRALFWRLMIASLVMLVGGYVGEAGMIPAALGFAVGMAGWIYIIYEVFAGEASKINAGSANAASQKAFHALRLIVTVGWAIYPLGYALGYMAGSASPDALNIIYNYADLINKTAFGLVIWAAAVADSQEA